MQRPLLSYYIISSVDCQDIWSINVTNSNPAARREGRQKQARDRQQKTREQRQASPGKRRGRGGRAAPGADDMRPGGAAGAVREPQTQRGQAQTRAGAAEGRWWLCVCVSQLFLCVSRGGLRAAGPLGVCKKSISGQTCVRVPPAASRCRQSRRGTRARRSDHAVTEYTPSTARQRCAKHGAHGVKCAAERPERAMCAEGAEQRTTAARTEGQARARR